MSAGFLNSLLSDVFDRANADAAGSLRLNALAAVLIERMEEEGLLTTPRLAYFSYERGNVAAEVHAYACDVEDDSLTLLYFIDATSETALGQPATAANTSKEHLDRAFRRLESFVKLVRSERMPDVEESQPANEMVAVLREALANEHAINLHVVTTGVVPDRASSAAREGRYQRELWDLIRLDRLLGRSASGAITIDLKNEFGRALPCLINPTASDGLQVLLTAIPGDLLASIYNQHRGALLERNVRSFLQFTGKVNQGIRETLIHRPHRFLPYNNGLSATASSVELRHIDVRLAEITVIRDFQIVNGGQTTASLASCARRDHIDLGAVTVPLKLTVVPAPMLEALVPEISRFANTQNRIQDSDFSANDPWHVELERISRHIWTPATVDAPRGTRWFYERSRGAYADAVAANQTAAGKRQFRVENPPGQKLAKTDIAKLYLAWDQYPAVVRKGAQKCFGFFMKQLGAGARKKPDETEFKRLAALAILFDCCERLYTEMGYQGARAEVVTFAISKFSHMMQRRLDFEQIWRDQAVPQQVRKALKFVIEGVNEVIVRPPASQQRVSEWAKKDECWTAVLEREIQLPDAFEGAAGVSRGGPGAPLHAFPESVSDAEKTLLGAVVSVPATVWFTVSGWAAETKTLQPWQRSIAYSLGTLANRGRPPSVKQARQGRKLLLEAHRLGFSDEKLDAPLLEKLLEVGDEV